MEKDAIAFLDEETVPEAPQEDPVEEQKVEAEPTEEAKPDEGETPEPEQKGEEPGEPPAPASEPQAIPITALLDEREKRQQAQRELTSLQTQLADMQRQMQELQKPKQEAPDWFDDPAAAAQFQQQQQAQQIQGQLMQQSRFLAEREFGAELVNETMAYFDRNPAASQQFANHPSPYHAAVEFYQRQKLADEIGSDPEAYKRRIIEEHMATLQPAPPSRPQSPPPSVASAPAAGQSSIVPGSGFDNLFPE